MQQLETLIKNVHVVTSRTIVPGFVGIAQGKIVLVGSGAYLAEAKQVIDGGGNYLLPGIVDPETSLSSTRSFRDDIETESKAAAATGITTWGLILASSVMGNETDRKSQGEIPSYNDVFPHFKEIGEKYSMVDFFLTAKIMNDKHATEIPKCASELGITSFKFLLQLMNKRSITKFWPLHKKMGDFDFDDGTVYVAFENVSRLGYPGIVCLHCENWGIARIFEERLQKAGRKDFKAWNERSPHFCEAMHVKQYSYLAKVTKCPIYICGVTAPETLEEMTRARNEGTHVLGQTGPHNLSLTEEVWRVNAPLRDPETIEKLWIAVRDGLIDYVGSDHVNPALTREEMEVPGDVWATKTGFASRGEALLPVMLSEGVCKGRITLQRLVEVCCENTARAFGIFPQKGSISVGADADLVLVDLNKRVRLTRDMIHSNAGWSVYEGREFGAWPIMTILRGHIISRWNAQANRMEIVASPMGKYLPRSIP